MRLSVWSSLGAVPLGGVLIALLLGPSRARRAAALAVAIALLAVPLSAAAPGLVRGMLALATTMILFRTIDLVVEPTAWAFARRAWHVLGIVDTRRVGRVPPAIAWPALRRLALAAPSTFAALWLATHVPPALGLLGTVLRCLGGVVFCYAAFEVVVAIVELTHRAFGRRVPVLHDAPILSITIEEFWGRRWNRTVGGWLRIHCFVPLARRRHAGLGVAAAFAASVALHVYVAWAALGATAAIFVGAFFAVQPPLMWAERALGVARWPVAAARVWTLGLLLLTSPLFVLPALRVFEPLLR